MKLQLNAMSLKAFMTFAFAMIVHTLLVAQEGGNAGNTTAESSTSVSTTETTTTQWYASPWVWVVGIAVFILLLVALLRGGSGKTVAGRTDQVTVTKTSSDI